jgi:hypothetical protein
MLVIVNGVLSWRGVSPGAGQNAAAAPDDWSALVGEISRGSKPLVSEVPGAAPAQRIKLGPLDVDHLTLPQLNLGLQLPWSCRGLKDGLPPPDKTAVGRCRYPTTRSCLGWSSAVDQ